MEPTNSTLDAMPQVLMQTPDDEDKSSSLVITLEIPRHAYNVISSFGTQDNADGKAETNTVHQTGSTLQVENLPLSPAAAKKDLKCMNKPRKSWSESVMSEAVTVVISGECSVRAAASKYSIPRSSLHDRVKKAKNLQMKMEPETEDSASVVAVKEEVSWGMEEEVPCFCRDSDHAQLKESDNVTSSIGRDAVNGPNRTKGRKYSWEEDDMIDAVNAIENKIMSTKTAASFYRVPLWALLYKTRSKSTVGEAGKSETKVRSRSKLWSQEDLDKASEAVIEQGMSIRKAALRFGMPKSSLSDQLIGRRGYREEFASKKEKVDQSLDVLAGQGGSDLASKGRRRHKTRLKTKVKRMDEKSLMTITRNGKNNKLGDEVQVHIIDEDVIIDSSDFAVRENEKFAPLEACYDGESKEKGFLVMERGKQAYEYDFNRQHSSTFVNREAAMQQSKAERSAGEKDARLDLLKGRITMTDEATYKIEGFNTTTKCWTQEEMDDAIKDVTENGCSIRKTASKYRIPKSSLADRISRGRCMNSAGRLLEELKPLAKSPKDVLTLKKFEDGKISPKVVAHRFGISFTRLQQLGSSKGIASSPKIGEVKTDALRDVTVTENAPTSRLINDLRQVADTKVRRERMRWKRNNLEQAITAVKEGRLSLRGSSKMFGIPKSTLGDVMRGKSSVCTRLGAKQILSEVEEASIAGWLVTMAKAGRHVKVKEVLETVKAILDKSGRTVPRFKDNLPKDSWWSGFLARHKEVAEIRKQSRVEGSDTAKNCGGGDSAVKAEVVKYADNIAAPLNKMYSGSCDNEKCLPLAIQDTNHDDEDALCSICGTANADENEEELWISCGVMNSEGTLNDGCGGWSHLNCTNLGERRLSAEELKNISWYCPQCTGVQFGDEN